MRSSAVIIAACSATASLAAPSSAHAQTPGLQVMDCPSLIARTEAARNIPRGLLMAIAMTESGLNGRPDPYAMNIAGRGYHANGFGDMTQVISSNWQRGVRSIDVGCMQINLKYHGDKFARMTDLLDPNTNVNYGASFLINLATSSGSWRDAVMSYHNRRNPSRRAWYGCKVWNNYLRISGSQTGYLACAPTPGGSSTAAVEVPGLVRTASYAVRGPGPLTPPGPAPAQDAMRPASIGGRIVDVAIPTDRVRGSIELVRSGESMPDVVQNDARQTAFNAVRPMDWAGRVHREASTSAGSTTSSSSAEQSGFGRVSRPN